MRFNVHFGLDPEDDEFSVVTLCFLEDTDFVAGSGPDGWSIGINNREFIIGSSMRRLQLPSHFAAGSSIRTRFFTKNIEKVSLVLSYLNGSPVVRGPTLEEEFWSRVPVRRKR